MVDEKMLLRGKWEAFKGEIGIQGRHIPVRVKGKTGRFRESWLMKDIEALGRE